jgi:methionyl-tRNA synthetase
MNIDRSSKLSYSEAYGVLCAAPASLSSRAGLYPTFCRIPKDGRSRAHAHFEAEIFFIVRGTGQMRIQAEQRFVTDGDLIRIPPFAEHELINTGFEELEFLSVYSEDFEVAALPKSVVVTAAPPTPNGPLHLGHIGGPYLAADVMARYLHLRSVNVQSHCGTDDHQNYVTERAFALDEEPEDFRRRMRSRILRGFNSMDIAFEEFIEPRAQPHYREKVLGFAERALEAGVLNEETIPLPHCADCNVLLVDCLVEGECPECQASSRGGCESCGVVVPPDELLNPKCTRCLKPATLKPTPVLTFDLSRYLPLIRGDLQALPLPMRLRELVAKAQKKTSTKVLVAYPANDSATESSGIYWSRMRSQLHVWFEMAAHYEDFVESDFWVHSFGFDNSFYYLLFIPALLRAVNAAAKLPDAVLTNEFFHLSGSKFSTSRAHAIWADEFTGDTDHLRFYLSLHRPSVASSDFVPEDFQRFSAKLSRQLQTFLDRARTVAPPTAGLVSQRTLVACNRHTRDMELYYSPQGFDLRRAARCILSFADLVEQSLRIAPDERILLQVFATTIAPITPRVSQQLLLALGVNERWQSDWSGAV